MLKGYKRVPRFVPVGERRACDACAFNVPGRVASEECREMQRLGPDNHQHPEYWCPTTIWIKDTPEAIAEYMALRLTNS